jgi:hypothetical protein
MFKALVGRETSTKLGPEDIIRKVLKRKCFKCPRIVHLNLICMSYDQKKGQESNLTPEYKSFESKGQMKFD